MFPFALSVIELSLIVSVAVLAIALVWLARRYLLLVSKVERQLQSINRDVKAVQATSLGMGKKLRQMKPSKVSAKEDDFYLGKAEQQMMAALKRTAMPH
ncbi:hypothetical protein [Salinibius halmophilus]|uniref:hypothetical protein n=1 Tax=Salinibius halmophilus TaxID=1853216 RepID=UPI000E6625F9|nr:hypothetical protein [Salinibius halmophilus]